MKTLSIRLHAFLRALPRMLRWVGEYPFLGFLVLLFIALLVSSLIFYRYVYRTTEGMNETVEIRFNRNSFENVIAAWEELEEAFEQADTLSLRNIFALPQELTE